jgi:dTMP kinase
MLYERLIEQGRKVHLTSEPSSGPIGHLIRLFFSGRVILPPDRETRDRQFAYLFAADRFDHLNNPTNGILKYLRDDVDVISTRFVLSSLAYNVENSEEEAFVQRLNADFITPDALIYLDCTVDLSVERMSVSRTTRDTYENQAKLETVRGNYERLVSSYTRPKLRVDASQPRQAIAECVAKFVEESRRFAVGEPLLRFE